MDRQEMNLSYDYGVGDLQSIEYLQEDTRYWREKPATINQLKVLSLLGVNWTGSLTCGRAADLIGEAKKKTRRSTFQKKKEIWR